LNKQKNVLFFYNHFSSFVKKDLEILSSEFHVHQHDFLPKKKWLTPFSFSSQKLFLLRYIWSADLIIVQFAGYHSFLPALYAKVFGKPCLIISGGTDAHYFPGIGYGNWQKKFLKTFTALSFRLCSHIAPKHKALMQCDYTYDSSEPAGQGIYARLPKLKTPFTEIPNGYDSMKWHRTKEKRKNTFITVSSAWEYSFQQQLKGIDLILEAAGAFPDCEFIILGVDDERRIVTKSKNVRLLPAVKNEDLINVFSECEFYMQLSMAEGFPNALCEAMLCECIPIGSNVFSIPEIIGDSGFVLMNRNVEELKKVIQSALDSDKNSLRTKARSRIAENYTLENRRQQLVGLCKNLQGL
jgi:glycosyltransferase involved in cell wall biosynthesis